MMQEALFYEPHTHAERDSSTTLRCLLCPHTCLIKEGKYGLCKVRYNNGGTLYAHSYGLASALALDPIEKKPLYHFFSGSTILSFGSFGCNMSCAFCQNFHISQTGIEFAAGNPQNATSNSQSTQGEYLAPDKLVELAESLKLQKNIGLAFTYNEPFINFEYMLDTARLAKQAGLKTVIITNGYVSLPALNMILPYIDALNIDLKAFNKTFYTKLCGAQLESVKKTIEHIVQNHRHAHLELTTLIIPTHNDSQAEMRELASWLSNLSPDIPFHINRHHPAWKMQSPPPIQKGALHALADIAKEYLKYVYVGNI